MSATEPAGLPKNPTGIHGFDRLTDGGLPAGRLSLVMGGPGAGKTIFAMQCLVNAVRKLGQKVLLLTFEEAPADLLANFQGFSWGLDKLVAEGSLQIVDARLTPEACISGQFDLTGFLAGVAARADRSDARLVVFDGLDVLMALLADPREEMRQMFELGRWVRDHGLTGLITGKMDGGLPGHPGRADMVQYVVDCVIALDMRVEGRIATRDLRVVKYRGSAFPPNRYPLVITPEGIEIFFDGSGEIQHKVSERKLSSGIARLDTMLGGGHFRGSSILVSGAPGTSKTTLAGAMAASVCQSGETTVFVSFDEAGDQIARNLRSVGLDLERHRASGRLIMSGLRADALSAENHVFHLRALIDAHRPGLLVIDPISALLKGGWRAVVDAVIQGILDYARSQGVTTFLTSLVNGDAPEKEVTDSHVSTMADTWIHLSYIAHGGERNRALTIVKSRGSAHSNQVRELILTVQGPTLADVYLAGGEVLMGTARLERESKDREAASSRARAYARQRMELEARASALRAQVAALEADLARTEAEGSRLAEEVVDVAEADQTRRQQIQASRSGQDDHPDTAPTPRATQGSQADG
ncbi:circadian clock protein KaiC [Pararhodospirillum oryzae]|nr:circadian clock protein KaiC [Pararhodospirillum oryzae]